VTFSVEKSPILGLLTIRPAVFEDHRGTFTETHDVGEFRHVAPDVRFVRDAVSCSTRHVLRGFHYDHKTWKLIQCLYGRIYFVVVDLREGSATWRRWESFVLSRENRMQILVPPSFGNGHLVLSDMCLFHYKLSEEYDPATEKVVRWDDPALSVYWPVTRPVLSEKDALASSLEDESGCP